MSSRDYWKGKRIAVIGIGANGEMLADIKFLIKSGALVALYDLRSEARLKSHILFLRSIGLANYVCGSIPPDDLLDMDIILLSNEYPRESSFLNKVKEEKKILIEYPETLFFKHAPPVSVIGVIGSCGKSTIISMLSPMLESVCAEFENQGFFVLDSESSDGILSNLKKIKSGDIVLLKVEENMMRELRDLRISPQVAIFTCLPEKNFYDQSPFELLAYQTYNNYVIGSDAVIDAIREYKVQPKAKMLRTKATLVPGDWIFNGKGDHDKDNAALALQAGRLFRVSDELAQSVLEKWKPLKGRLEMVKKVKNVEFYNDTYSVSPMATLTGVKSLANDRNTILIFGGADRGHKTSDFYSSLGQYIKVMITLPGSGTLRERKALAELKDIEVLSAPSLEEAVNLALDKSMKGDRVLFSPGFGAGGYDSSRKERGERYIRAVRALV